MQIEIRRPHERVGATTVYVIHDQYEALTIWAELQCLREAVCSSSIGPDRIYDQPSNVFVADFIGPSNLLPTEVEGGNLSKTCLAGAD